MDIKEQKIEVGQVWAYTATTWSLKDPNHHIKNYNKIPANILNKHLAKCVSYVEFVIEITEVTKDTIYGNVVKAHWGYDVGDKITMLRGWLTGHYKCIFGYSGEVGDKTNVCIKCKKSSEYAKKAIGFKCWSCKNGY